MKFYFSAFLIFVAHFCFSQKTVTDTFVIPKNKTQNEVKEIVCPVEQMPEFVGGEGALFKFIQDNLSYPSIKNEEVVSGKIVISFIVNEDGSLSDFIIKKSVYESFDEEALRVVKKMPKFIPGKVNGKAVKTSYLIPFRICFK